MRNTRNCTRPRRLRALTLALCLLMMTAALADDLASDLGGGYQAATPSQMGVYVDMTTADVKIGYIDPKAAKVIERAETKPPEDGVTLNGRRFTSAELR